MRYAILIWFVAAFALWDVRMNRAQYTDPVTNVVHRIVGGH